MPRSHVWIPDDSPLEAEVAAQALRPLYDVESFIDGATLLKQLSLREAPDVLVLDGNLPGMTGPEICRFVRQTRDELALPVLIFTASTQRELIVHALREGANDFVAKPYVAEELVARVATLARVGKLAKIAAQQAIFERQLIGIVSRDLRNPLGAILLAAQLLGKQRVLDGPGERIRSRLVSSGKRAQRLINDILDFSVVRVGSGLPITPSSSDLRELLRQAVEEARAHHPERVVEIEAAAPCPGTWDEDRLSQVLVNLLGNAFQCSSPSTPVRIALSLDDATARVSVHNEGLPIPAETQARIFEPMERGSSQANPTGRSVGLGLFIVDHIVRAHQGTVKLASTAEAGTTFVITLPRNLEVAPKRASVPRLGDESPAV